MEVDRTIKSLPSTRRIKDRRSKRRSWLPPSACQSERDSAGSAHCCGCLRRSDVVHEGSRNHQHCQQGTETGDSPTREAPQDRKSIGRCAYQAKAIPVRTSLMKLKDRQWQITALRVGRASKRYLLLHRQLRTLGRPHRRRRRPPSPSHGSPHCPARLLGLIPLHKKIVK